MAWTSWIDAPGRIVYTSVSGTLTFEDAIVHRRELAGRADFNPTFRHLLDLSNVTRVALNHDQLVLLASQSILSPRTKQVIVAPSDAVFAAARTYYAYRNQERAREDIFVCRTLSEAYARLSVEDPLETVINDDAPVRETSRLKQPLTDATAMTERNGDAAVAEGFVLVVCESGSRADRVGAALIDTGFLALVSARTVDEATEHVSTMRPSLAIVDVDEDKSLQVCAALRAADQTGQLRLVLLANLGAVHPGATPPNGLLSKDASPEVIASEARRLASMPERRSLTNWDRRGLWRGGRRRFDQIH